MTRKHFEAIARALADIKPADPVGQSKWRTCVATIADTLAQESRTFRRQTFVDACNP